MNIIVDHNPQVCTGIGIGIDIGTGIGIGIDIGIGTGIGIDIGICISYISKICIRIWSGRTKRRLVSSSKVL